MKALIDTNILLDVIYARLPFYHDSKRVLQLINEKKMEGYVSVQSLKDVFYLCKKLKNGKEPLRTIEDLSFLLNVIDVTGADSISTLTSDVEDYEDGLLIFSAKRNGIEAVITRDKTDFFESDLIVINPKDIDQYLSGKVKVGCIAGA